MKTAHIKIFFIAFCSWISFTASAQQHRLNLALLEQEKVEMKQITVVNNNSALPITELEHLRIASVDLGFSASAVFDSLANKYTSVDALKQTFNPGSINRLNALNDELKLYNCIILKVNKSIGEPLENFIRELEKSKKVVVVLTGAATKNSWNFRSVVVKSSLNTALTASSIAQLIFGGISTNHQAIRLHYSVPESVGINREELDSIPLIVQQAIQMKGAPGAVVMIIKDGQVIFNEAYGTHKYAGSRKTRINDIFDMASVTKLAATTNTAMQLFDAGKLSIDSPISTYIAKTREMADKKDIRVKEVLLHQAGFYPYIKFYERLKQGDTDTTYSAKYPTQLADGYYLRAHYFDEVMWPEMLSDRALTRGSYVYSDLSMYYMKEIVEKIAEKPLNEYVQTHFYTPLGMKRAGFLPRMRFERDEIVPTTENDGWLRSMPVQGFVNDPGAAMLGGVSGHAGFFASANDMAILGQMWLNQGNYGGKTYINPETLKLFTSSQSTVSRRRLGFDRKDPDPKKGYPSKLASDEVFGHTGYTGTAIWVDPKYKLIYIFLSNRVYPDDQNKSLNTLNIRARIMDVIYSAIKKD